MDIKSRFGQTAATGKPPTPEQIVAVARLRDQCIDLALLIVDKVPPGRNQSIALTALEDVQMRANRGIFAEEGNA